MSGHLLSYICLNTSPSILQLLHSSRKISHYILKKLFFCMAFRPFLCPTFPLRSLPIGPGDLQTTYSIAEKEGSFFTNL